MNREKQHYDLNPSATASCLTKLIFWWIFSFIRESAKQNRHIQIVFPVLDEDQSDALGTTLTNLWNKQCSNASKKNGSNPKYYKALFYAHSKLFPLYGMLGIFNECIIKVAQTIFFQRLITSFSDQDTSFELQLLYGTGVVLSAVIYTLIVHAITFAHQHIGMKCRVGSCSVLYQKALKLSRRAQCQTTVGKIVNLISNDTSRFDTNLYILHYLYVAPIQMGILVYLMWTYENFGLSCLFGSGLIISLIPVQLYTTTLLQSFRSQLAQWTDNRGQTINEVINAITVIKMYAWEKAFASLIDQTRRTEIKFLRKVAFLRAFYMSLYVSFSKIVLLLTIFVLLTNGGELKPDSVYFMVAAYNIILQSMIQYFPAALTTLSEIMVSTNRIESFLLLDEKQSPDLASLTSPWLDEMLGFQCLKARLSIASLHAKWTMDEATLQSVNIRLNGDQLVMIVGPVGAGKSSFLQAVLGELPVNDGYLKLHGVAAYSSQEAWIFPGNIRENILFGTEYDKERYSEILYVSALNDDLKKFPLGDLTVVGERGLSLSGGQKARINLARTLYQDAAVYLLDDPLSAVDAQVSRHIFEKCFVKYLKGKLRFLITHQLHYLPQADYAIVLNAGKIEAQGTHYDLVSQGVSFLSTGITNAEETKPMQMQHREATNPAFQLASVRNNSLHGTCNELPHNPSPVKTRFVASKIYWNYFTTGHSGFGLVILGVIFVAAQLIVSATDYWLSYWISQSTQFNVACNNTVVMQLNNSVLAFSSMYLQSNTFMYEIQDNTGPKSCTEGIDNFYLYVYIGLIVALVLFSTSRALYFSYYFLQTSVNIHDTVIKNIMTAPAAFFVKTSSGSILNRLTKDISVLDELLPPIFFDAATMVLIILGIIIVVIITNYFIAIPCAILLVVMYFIRGFYNRTLQNIKRMECKARSPILTHLASTINGLTTIRSCNREPFLVEQFNSYQDQHSALWFIYIAISRWAALWIELTSLLFLVVVTYGSIILAKCTDGEADSSKIGLAISSVMGFAGAFQWVVRRMTETENMMTSVDRVFEYTKLETESVSPVNTDEHLVDKHWPPTGKIQFNQVCLYYDQKRVLQNISFDVKPKEKIGIVGSTGAGKSSIIACLFRLVDPEGEILIDDVSITKIELSQLRTNISIIPQDPILFTGNIRYNLDPFNQFSDDLVWKVIEQVRLKDAIRDLNHPVSYGGSNFSTGQKQLICLGRAILRQNKILVIDEATANVDPETDDFIQATIRSLFSDCTVITIAHRFHTVIDCDRILVLNNGSIMEYDHPYILLQNPDSFWNSMVQHTGTNQRNILHRLSEEAFLSKKSIPDDHETVKS